jgi:hypothetical protein
MSDLSRIRRARPKGLEPSRGQTVFSQGELGITSGICEGRDQTSALSQIGKEAIIAMLAPGDFGRAILWRTTTPSAPATAITAQRPDYRQRRRGSGCSGDEFRRFEPFLLCSRETSFY